MEEIDIDVGRSPARLWDSFRRMLCWSFSTFQSFLCICWSCLCVWHRGHTPHMFRPHELGASLNCSDVKNGLKETPEGTSLESRSLCCGVMSAPELWVCKGVSEHSILWGTELSLACFMTGQRNAKMENSALLSCFLLSYLFGFSLCILVLSYSCSSSYPWCERRAEQNGVFLPHLPCLTLWEGWDPALQLLALTFVLVWGYFASNV